MKYFNLFKKRAGKAFILAVLVNLPILAFNQTAHYLGHEKNITRNFLLEKAKIADYGQNCATNIYNDEKNSYYAINLHRIPSRYVKIRVLELTYQDKTLVNMDSDINGNYLLFLVNNILNRSSEKVILQLEKYKTKAIGEAAKMTQQEITLYLIHHDKYNK